MTGLWPCLDGFHSDECPGCRMPSYERDAALVAEAYAKGQAAERERIDTSLVNTADDVADVYCISIDQWDAIIEGNA